MGMGYLLWVCVCLFLPVVCVVLFIPSIEQMRDHLHDTFGGFWNVPPIFRLGMASLNHLLLGTFFKSFIKGPKSLSGPMRPLASEAVIALGNAFPAPVLVYNHGVLVRVLLQNTNVWLDQPQQVQFLRQSKVWRASLAHCTVRHEESRHIKTH